MATLKRSVTVDSEVLDELSTERRANLSATVNAGLHLLAALDAQQEAVDIFEAQHGEVGLDELRPYLDAVIRAQAASLTLPRRTRAKARTR